MRRSKDRRPPVAIGHVSLAATDVDAAAQWFERLGLRPIAGDEDLDATHRDFAAKGLKPSRIRRGTIHDSFALAGPDGYAVTVLSSHAGRRPV
jgi:catechol 2,3-dioxygenase-like lactoylglutathione lyase family enzyme